MFDDYLAKRGTREHKAYQPLDIASDYRRYVDGIPRYDGVRNFLASRHITLPEGNPTDAPGQETVAGLGNLKNVYFQQLVQQGGVDIFNDTVNWLQEQRRNGLRTAVISASKNCKAILEVAGLEDLFEARVDGVEAAKLGLKGKPAPDVFWEAARRLGVQPAEAAIFEDALAGVQAGRAGGFALVVGVDREHARQALIENGADLVLDCFPETDMMTQTHNTAVQKREASQLPSILDHLQELRTQLKDKKTAVFLDYDGCLTPIVKDPARALLSEDMRQVLRSLANECLVAVVSGRDRADVAGLVQLDNLYFAGSHGFDITGPGGVKAEPADAKETLPELDQAEKELQSRLQHVAGAMVERKRYAIAVHYRNVADKQVQEVITTVDKVLARHQALKKGLGKKIVELKPNLDWHKGKAVLWLLDKLGLQEQEVLPLYIGDDITDEDAFAALQEAGMGILVGEHEEKTAARYRLQDVAQVQTFLQELTQLLK